MTRRRRINQQYQPQMLLEQPTWEYIKQKISQPREQGSRKVPLMQPTWEYEAKISVTMQRGQEEVSTHESLNIDLQPKESLLY